MARIIWSKRGLSDFQEHLSHIEKTSLQNAKQVAKSIIKKIDMLVNFPEMGRVVPEFAQKELREIIVYQYRVVYRVRSLDTVEIINIYHSKQLLKP
jgi:toxin ParE1/3/4